jgi:hypothetical protein
VLALGALSGLVATYELGCRGTGDGASLATPYEAISGAPADTRIESWSWLTCPEWHIVYSAESFAAHLEQSPPSTFAYGREIGGFWSSYCAVNRATTGMPDRRGYKVTIYIIGISYTLELAAKAAYERTAGALIERLAGADSADDRYAARVQVEYGAFLHETPWYRYPFRTALEGLWAVDDRDEPVRHWERRLALSAEYGVKAVYARAIGALVGATGYDERTLRFVVRGEPYMLRDEPRFTLVSEPRPGLLLVDAPRYEQFTALMRTLASSNAALLEIAGNDDIFITALVPIGRDPGSDDGQRLFTIAVDGHPGFERVGLSVKVPALQIAIRRIEAAGGSLEHVYDY